MTSYGATRNKGLSPFFLLALATARRVSELQALSKDIGWSSNTVRLSYLASFVAKNETRSHPIPRSFSVTGLMSLVGRDSMDYLLCPVRSLKEYVNRTELLRGQHLHLFCSTKDPAVPMTKNGMSFFLKDLIRKAHEDCPSDALPLFKLQARNVRAVATSFSFLRNVPLRDILDTVCWKTDSVFATNYLKDLSFRYGDCHSLGPVVAAGAILP